MRRITKKIYSAVFFCIVILICAIVWESVYNNHSEEAWVYKFEKRLHRQERVADEILKQFKDSVDIDQYRSQKDMIFVGLKNGKLFFWTDEIVGMNGLYDLLPLENRFAKINNSYYEIRRRNYKEIEYIALLHIKDDYPYTNKYIKNHFGKFLKVKAENVDNIDVSPEVLPGGTAIKDIEGNILFYIRHSADYKDRSVNYILLSLYVLFFLTLFYIYGLVLRNTTSLKRQLVYFALFSFMLMLLHYMMYEYRVPDSLYRLRIFDPSKSPGGFVLSVGDLLITVFSLAQILYLSLSNLRFNYKSKTLRRYRYVVLTVFLLLILGYMVIFSNTIGALIESKDVYLNIARIIEIDMLSIIAFLSIIVAGLIMVIFIDGMVSVMKNVVPLKKLLLFVAIVTIPTACIFACLKNDVLFIGTALILIVFSLAILNCYVTKREIQRSIYLLIIFLLSIHIVLVERNLEEKRELLLRKEFAMELINERDYNFEKKLLELDGRINDSEEIKSFARNYDEEGVLNYLYSGFLEMAGYNYLSNIIFCRSEDLLNVGTEGKQYNCHEYFNQLLQKSGVRIDNTHFYAIDEFDGVASYVGKFVLGDTYLILRFDSGDESEGVGYPQLLSRRSVEGNDITYPYSYAKYKNSQLIKSSGFFNYYKSLDLLGKYDTIQNVSIKDDHSHMFIPVDDENVLIISLHKNFFSIYYLNILYVFFICILFSSYGMFFNLNSGMNFKKGSLKARIKNSILSLVFSLFIILTFFSIWITTKGYEKRHYIKAIELLKYLNKELEQLDCVEYWECPHITENLAGWSEVFMADINIYSDRGRLVATSRPEIFSNGFSGYLVDPVAFQRIIDEKSTNYVVQKKIGEMSYMSAYVPLQIGEDKLYILNIPYFAQNDELNQNIFILIIVMMNIAAIVMALAFILSGIIAGRVTKPLQMVNEKLKQMRLGGKNEKIDYNLKDEVGGLVREYNNMVEKLEEHVEQLARSERETAWREMAKQIAHEIKNPLTPMKLNIQFMQRSMQISDPDEFREKFKNISNVLIEQIDNMAAIASVFSDFAKISDSEITCFDVSELMLNCAKLFENNVDVLSYDIESNLFIFADRQQIHRVFVNVIKNAIQSIPEGKKGMVLLKIRAEDGCVVISVKDNGSGIPEDVREKVFEPNFTTKTKGTGLGLAISKRIIENAGGEIDFNTTEEGTEFVIILKM